MRIVTRSPRQAVGSPLAHALPLPSGRRLPKGHRLSAAEAAALETAGVLELPVALPEPGDVAEDEAAARIAAALAGPHLSAAPAARGRADLIAGTHGLLAINEQAVARLNAADDGIRLATLPPWQAVGEGIRVASVKVIPLAVPEPAIESWIDRITGARRPVLRIHPFRKHACWLVETEPLHHHRRAKSYREALETRLARLGGRLAGMDRCAHRVSELAALLTRLHRRLAAGTAIIIGPAASAVGRDDVAPAAIAAAGGRILSFGLAVEPGNLLITARLGRRPVVVLPSSARAPGHQGADLVLARMAAGLPVTAAALAPAGIGGLLGAAPERRPARRRAGRRPRLGVILLAAGSGRRFGADKLMADWRGKPLAAHAAASFRDASVLMRIAVVRPGAVHLSEILQAAGFTPVVAQAAEAGMAESLKAGVAFLHRQERQLGAVLDGVFIMLADMPAVRPETVTKLVDAFARFVADENGTADAVVPTHEGRRGHPVLLRRGALDLVSELRGDVGLKPLFAAGRLTAHLLPVEDPGVVIDVDDMAALAALEAPGRKS